MVLHEPTAPGSASSPSTRLCSSPSRLTWEALQQAVIIQSACGRHAWTSPGRPAPVSSNCRCAGMLPCTSSGMLSYRQGLTCCQLPTVSISPARDSEGQPGWGRLLAAGGGRFQGCHTRCAVLARRHHHKRASCQPLCSERVCAGRGPPRGGGRFDGGGRGDFGTPVTLLLVARELAQSAEPPGSGFVCATLQPSCTQLACTQGEQFSSA